MGKADVGERSAPAIWGLVNLRQQDDKLMATCRTNNQPNSSTGTPLAVQARRIQLKIAKFEAKRGLIKLRFPRQA
jgi:hypothetical protein